MKRINMLVAFMLVVASSVIHAQEAKDQELIKAIIVRFPFESGVSHDATTAFSIVPNFKRESAAYAGGKNFKEQEPKLVKGKNGNGLLLESAYENLLPEGQASAKDIAAFKAVGSEIAIIKSGAFEGEEAISIATKGENAEEGMIVELPIDKLMYSGGRAISATYVASVYLKGEGNIKLILKTADGEIQSEPIYETLTPVWKRYSACICFKEATYQIGPKHEQDWKTLLPAGTNIETKIEFHILTQDQGKMQLQADAFQVEPRYLHYANTAGGASPHTWVPGKMKVKEDYFDFETRLDYFREFKKNGSISFWMKPLWDVRDSTLDVVLNLAPNALRLQHASSSFIMAPAGMSYRPFDFRDEWHHIVITWNEAGERKLYVDSMEYNSPNGEKAPIKSLQSFAIGDGANASANAIIDDLILFQTNLTPEQVSQVAQWQSAPAKTGVEEVKKDSASQSAPSNTISNSAAPSNIEPGKEEKKTEAQNPM
jgi:hypothetical protein